MNKNVSDSVITIIGVILLGLGIMIFGGAFGNIGISLTPDGISTINVNDFVIIQEETTGERKEDGTYVITGKIKQNTNESYTSIMPVLNLLDKNNRKVRETSGLTFSEYLGDNIWSFSVSGNDADGIVTGFELSYCMGY